MNTHHRKNTKEHRIIYIFPLSACLPLSFSLCVRNKGAFSLDALCCDWDVELIWIIRYIFTARMKNKTITLKVFGSQNIALWNFWHRLRNQMHVRESERASERKSNDAQRIYRAQWSWNVAYWSAAFSWETERKIKYCREKNRENRKKMKDKKKHTKKTENLQKKAKFMYER